MTIVFNRHCFTQQYENKTGYETCNKVLKEEYINLILTKFVITNLKLFCALFKVCVVAIVCAIVLIWFIWSKLTKSLLLQIKSHESKNKTTLLYTFKCQWYILEFTNWLLLARTGMYDTITSLRTQTKERTPEWKTTNVQVKTTIPREMNASDRNIKFLIHAE